MRRAAVSVPANIAEGYGRHRPGDYCRFIDTARGSLYELQTHTIISRRQQFLTEPVAARLESAVDEVARLLYGLAESLKKCRR